MSEQGTVTRRRMLAGAAGMAVSTAGGCLEGIRAGVERDAPEQVSLTIKTLPADENRIPIQIARHLAQNMERAGMAVDILPTTANQLFRDILVNRDYDIYVAQHPGHEDPDYLYSLLHSRFIEEPGWQNPFGYANVALVDHLLEDQRRAEGEDRQTLLDELQLAIAEDAPFATVAFPDKARATREDRFIGWDRYSLGSPLGYLSIEPGNGVPARNGREEETLHVGTVDTRITRNLNPFAVEFRFRGVVMGLLYDYLGRVVDDTVIPWLAETWDWRPQTETYQSLRVHLRDDLTWHDGTDLTADDVVFSYRFITDTTMDDGDPIVPVPRFRGRSTLVESVWPVDESTVEIRFGPDISEKIAKFALTIPIIPRHEWEDRTDLTEIIGFGLDNVTEALIWDNLDPVGSGPFRVDSIETDEKLVLERFEDHILHHEGLSGDVTAFDGRPRYERVSFEIYPSESAIIEMLAAGDLDATASGLSGDGVVRAGRSDGVSLRITSSTAHYHVGFNNRMTPLNNPRFRNALSKLIDREFIVEEIFNRYAIPSLSPIMAGGEVPEELVWTADHEFGFLGGDADGLVDRDRAHDVFRDAGFLYRDDELLLQ